MRPLRREVVCGDSPLAFGSGSEVGAAHAAAAPARPMPGTRASHGHLRHQLGTRRSGLTDQNSYVGPYFCRDLGMDSSVS